MNNVVLAERYHGGRAVFIVHISIEERGLADVLAAEQHEL